MRNLKVHNIFVHKLLIEPKFCQNLEFGFLYEAISKYVGRIQQMNYESEVNFQTPFNTASQIFGTCPFMPLAK